MKEIESILLNHSEKVQNESYVMIWESCQSISPKVVIDNHLPDLHQKSNVCNKWQNEENTEEITHYDYRKKVADKNSYFSHTREDTVPTKCQSKAFSPTFYQPDELQQPFPASHADLKQESKAP